MYRDINITVGGHVNAEYPKVYKTKFLKPGIPFGLQVTDTDTKYVIKYNFDLGGESVTIRERCILEFDGGSLANGSLVGTVRIINKPDDLYELVNCMELYVINETHLSVGDISDFIDRYNYDEVVSQDAINSRFALSHFYCIAGMDKIIFRIPSHAFDNAQGTTYPYLPYMRYLFYDRDFKYIDVRPEWTAREEMYVFDNIPEGAAYINVFFSDDDHLNKPMILQDVLKYMYFNFLDNTKVYIGKELINNADVINFTASQRAGNTIINYYSYTDPSAADKYIKGTWSIGNLTRSSYFIPRSILKNYDYIELVGHGVGARYTFIDNQGNEEERAYNPMVIAFLKKTPLYDHEDVEYSDTYPWRVSFPQAQRVTLAIPDDCKCIFITKVEVYMSSMWDCSPAQILLKKKSACDIGGFDANDLSKISNRDVKTSEIKFIHWNIGADNIGGMLPRMEDATPELLAKRRASFEAFFATINRSYNLLFNELDYWFDSEHSINYESLVASSVWYGRKRFDMRQYQNLGIYYKNNLLEYRYGTFECLRGFTGNPADRKCYYSYGYVIYHYPISGANLYIMHTHLPTPLDGDSMKMLYREMKSITAPYPNVVIIGDFNDAGDYNPHTQSGNRYSRLEEVFTEESGWHIANKELDDTPTYDFGKDFWNPTQPAAGRINLILDFCIWRGAYISMTDFRVRRDAIIVGSEALEATEDVFINDNGSVEGNESYINHRLSDHWPIEFTIKFSSGYSIVPDTEGSTRYNKENKKLEWHDDEKWVACGVSDGENYQVLESNAVLANVYNPGTYLCYDGTTAATIQDYPFQDKTSGFTMKVLPIGNTLDWGRRAQIIFNTGDNLIAIRYSRDLDAQMSRTGYYDWRIIRPFGMSWSHYGVYSNRPTLNQYDAGFVYFDTTLQKAVMWTGSVWIEVDNDIRSQKTLGVGDSIILGWRNNYWSFLGYIGEYKTNAVAGAKFITSNSYNVKNIPQQLLDETSYEPDNIITGTGVNDWALNSPLGTLPTAVVTNDTAANALDRTTVYGAMQFLFYQMVKKFPSAKRFFVTATKFDCNVNVDIHGKWTDTNSQGYSYKEMLEGIKQICELYGVVYIDVLNKGFVNSEFATYKAPTKYNDVPEADKAEWNRTYYIDGDGLHPTDRCYREVYAPIVHEAMGITQRFHEYQ